MTWEENTLEVAQTLRFSLFLRPLGHSIPSSNSVFHFSEHVFHTSPLHVMVFYLPSAAFLPFSGVSHNVLLRIVGILAFSKCDRLFFSHSIKAGGVMIALSAGI